MKTDDTTSQLAIQMLDQLSDWRKLLTSPAEALAGIHALLKNHTQALAGHQHIIEALAGELGVPVQDVDPDAPQRPPPLN